MSADSTTITDIKTPPVKKTRLKKVRSAATNVLIIGYLVLVPLVAMAMVVVMTYPNAGADAVLKVEITYAAALLSFLGGIRWGIALMAGYLAVAVGERLGGTSPVPDWYRNLLVPLTVMIEIALALTLFILLTN